MKRILAMILVVAMAMMMLAACSSEKAEPTPTVPTNPIEGAIDGVGDVAQGVVDGVTDVVAGVGTGIASMVGGLGAEAQMFGEVDATTYKDVHGIDKTKYEDVAIMASPKDTHAKEIILIKAKDEANLKEAVKDLEARKTALDTKWAAGATEQYEIVKKSIVKTKGNYAVLIVAENYAEAEKAFDSLDI